MSNNLPIEVDVIGVSARGLEPAYDEDAGVLELRNRKCHEWPLGVDIDGSIIFDLDKQRRVANIDILFRKDLWLTNEVFGMPTGGREGALRFRDSAIKTKSFSGPVAVNIAGRVVRVLIGSSNTEEGLMQTVWLGKSCAATLHNSKLCGLWVKL